VARYRLRSEFPREGFLQEALELHFADCRRHAVGHADLACTDAEGRRWLIEAQRRWPSIEPETTGEEKRIARFSSEVASCAAHDDRPPRTRTRDRILGRVVSRSATLLSG
jgi:hypothetical protein